MRSYFLAVECDCNEAVCALAPHFCKTTISRLHISELNVQAMALNVFLTRFSHDVEPGKYICVPRLTLEKVILFYC